MDTFPLDILLYTFSFLHKRDLLHCRKVCWKFAAIIDNFPCVWNMKQVRSHTSVETIPFPFIHTRLIDIICSPKSQFILKFGGQIIEHNAMDMTPIDATPVHFLSSGSPIEFGNHVAYSISGGATSMWHHGILVPPKNVAALNYDIIDLIPSGYRRMSLDEWAEGKTLHKIKYSKCLPVDESIELALSMWQLQEDYKTNKKEYAQALARYIGDSAEFSVEDDVTLQIGAHVNLSDEYGAFTWTCEHFVAYCKTGDKHLPLVKTQTDKLLEEITQNAAKKTREMKAKIQNAVSFSFVLRLF